MRVVYQNSKKKGKERKNTIVSRCSKIYANWTCKTKWREQFLVRDDSTRIYVNPHGQATQFSFGKLSFLFMKNLFFWKEKEGCLLDVQYSMCVLCYQWNRWTLSWIHQAHSIQFDNGKWTVCQYSIKCKFTTLNNKQTHLRRHSRKCQTWSAWDWTSENVSLRLVISPKPIWKKQWLGLLTCTS